MASVDYSVSPLIGSLQQPSERTSESQCVAHLRDGSRQLPDKNQKRGRLFCKMYFGCPSETAMELSTCSPEIDIFHNNLQEELDEADILPCLKMF